jgi:hypothetical protein
MGDAVHNKLVLQRQRGTETAYRCWKLRTEEGLTTYAIAERLTTDGHKITQQGVVAALRRGEAAVWQSIHEYVGADKATQLRRLEKIYEEAMAAWRESKKTQTRKTSRQVENAKGSAKLAQVQQHDSAGDARYLAVAHKAVESICRIEGHHAPLKVQPVNGPRPHGETPEVEMQRLMTETVRDMGGIDRMRQILEASAIDVTPEKK